MIFLNVLLDNFYMFDQTVLDLTYKRKIKNSSIDHEYLEGYENIKFKRVCILSGSNASGKTAFGKMLNEISCFLDGHSLNHLSECIREPNKPANFKVIFIDTINKTLNSVNAEFSKDGVEKEIFKSVKLRSSYSYDTMLEILAEATPITNFDINSDTNEVKQPGFKSVSHMNGNFKFLHSWNFCMSNPKESKNSGMANQFEPLYILEFLKSFDSSIIDIRQSNDETNENKVEYLVDFKNKDSVRVIDGLPSQESRNRLSMGTFDAITLAHFSLWVKNLTSGTFYLDEKMAYCHTEMEKAILNLLIEQLGRNAQLFFTTHNMDIFDLRLPTHSYVFLKKEEFTEVLHPEKLGYSKNDRSLVSLIENDVFDTLPDTHLIDNLL